MSTTNGQATSCRTARQGPLGRQMADERARRRELEQTLTHIARTTNDPVAARQARRALEDGSEDDVGGGGDDA